MDSSSNPLVVATGASGGLQIVTQSDIQLLLLITGALSDHALLQPESPLELFERVNILAAGVNSSGDTVALLVVDIVSLLLTKAMTGSTTAMEDGSLPSVHVTMSDLLVRAHQWCRARPDSDVGPALLVESVQMLLFVLMDVYVRESRCPGTCPEVSSLMSGIHYSVVTQSSVKTTAADSLLGFITDGLVTRLEPTLADSSMQSAWKLHSTLLIAYLESMRHNFDATSLGDMLYGVRIPQPLLKVFNYTGGSSMTAAVDPGNSYMAELLLQILLSNGGELLQCCEIARLYYDSLSTLLEAAAAAGAFVATTTPTQLADSLVHTCVKVLCTHSVRLLPTLLVAAGKTNPKLLSLHSAQSDISCDVSTDYVSMCVGGRADSPMVYDAKTKIMRLHPDICAGLVATNTTFSVSQQQHMHVLLLVHDEFVSLQSSISRYYKQLFRYEVGINAAR
jgi:hypothetical protein